MTQIVRNCQLAGSHSSGCRVSSCRSWHRVRKFAARIDGGMLAQRSQAGHPLVEDECQSAAICHLSNAVMVRCAMSNYRGAGVDILDPWEFHERHD